METMLATNDLRTILDEAEKAVAREDPAAAERLLRDALTLQEAAVGSQQYEIAKTLNNLAIVCEMSGKKAEAEGCYRRAYEIARSNLPPDDPFVTTSRENLEEFCKVQGVEIEWPAESSLMMLEPEPERAPAPAPPLRPVREPVHPVELPLHATSPSPHAPVRSPGVTFQSVAVPPTPSGPSRI